jgi:hypothetical protein
MPNHAIEIGRPLERVANKLTMIATKGERLEIDLLPTVVACSVARRHHG